MQQQVSPRAGKARENNALEILKNLASQVSPTMPVEQLQQGQQMQAQPMQEQEQPKPFQNEMFNMPQATYQQPEIDEDAIAFDDKGNFKKPPYEGFWADRLAEVDPQNPLLEHGAKIRSFLSEIDKVVYGR